MTALAGGSAGNRLLVAAFCAFFFAYLFGPLVIMVITAFNSAEYPRIAPWDCFTTDWFRRFGRDTLLLQGLANSFVIGIGVVLLALPIGLAAALALSEVGPRLRSALYALFIVPILLPGVVIGIATLLFWGRLAAAVGLGHDTFLYDGIFLTILGQTCFVAAYAMLVFTARLQRFDATLTEAALDLGASPGQAFRRILLPFLRPAIGSAAVLAFLASMENYNTTVFTIVSESTFTTVLASKVRFGIDPSISAIAVIIIAVTLVGAIVHEAHLRRSERVLAGRVMASPAARLVSHPATVALALLAVCGALAWAGGRYDSDACEYRLLQEKRARQEQLMEEQRRRMQQQAPAAAPATPSGGEAPKPFGGVFTPQNLGGGSKPAEPASPGPSPGKPASPFGDVFTPQNLGGGRGDEKPAAPGAPAAPASPFAPGNLRPSGN